MTFKQVMKQLNDTQAHCLKHIGITQWQLGRETLLPQSKLLFAVYFDSGSLQKHDEILCKKMLAALNWPWEAVQLVSTAASETDAINGYLSSAANQIWFGFERAKHFNLIEREEIAVIQNDNSNLIICPSLSLIHDNNDIKKQIWQALKPFKQ